jgi:SAM-dependent methyltransferase
MTRAQVANDSDPIAISRSRWLAKSVVPELGLRSLLEVGTNSGRNLQYIAKENPGIELKGIDVNPRAIEFARSKGLDIEFEVVDANEWSEPSDRWDGVLTMSVLDHSWHQPTSVESPSPGTPSDSLHSAQRPPLQPRHRTLWHSARCPMTTDQKVRGSSPSERAASRR